MTPPDPDPRPCAAPGCRSRAEPGLRYCNYHRDQLMRAMKRDRYLTPAPPPRQRNHPANREDQGETRRGKDD